MSIDQAANRKIHGGGTEKTKRPQIALMNADQKGAQLLELQSYQR
jgi:hypothetical protein